MSFLKSSVVIVAAIAFVGCGETKDSGTENQAVNPIDISTTLDEVEKSIVAKTGETSLLSSEDPEDQDILVERRSTRYVYEKVFTNPRSAHGRKIDVCLKEYGEGNCGSWAINTIVDRFCQDNGYDERVGTVYWIEQSRVWGTEKLHITKRNGVEVQEWRYCSDCGNYLSKVTCKKVRSY